MRIVVYIRMKAYINLFFCHTLFDATSLIT